MFDLRRPGTDVLLRGGILHRDKHQQGRDQSNCQDAEVCREETRPFFTEMLARVAKAVTRL